MGVCQDILLVFVFYMVFKVDTCNTSFLPLMNTLTVRLISPKVREIVANYFYLPP